MKQRRFGPLFMFFIFKICDCSTWIEDFNTSLKHWENDDGLVMKLAKSEDLNFTFNSNIEKLLVIEFEPNSTTSRTDLYFYREAPYEIEDAELLFNISVLGCESRVKLFWDRKEVLRGPMKCPRHMWIHLNFSTFITEHRTKCVDLRLQFGPGKESSSATSVIISKLEVRVIPPVHKYTVHEKLFTALPVTDESFHSTYQVETHVKSVSPDFRTSSTKLLVVIIFLISLLYK